MTRPKILKLLFIFLLAVTPVFATPQIPDILIHEGKEYPIFTNWLDEYFQKFPDRNPKPDEYMCSALWRGYRATFATENGRIFLKDIAIKVCGGNGEPALDKVTPNKERLYIDWANTLLRSAYGENRTDPYSIESLDSYETYSLFEVVSGRISEVRHFSNTEFKAFRKRQAAAYIKTDEYKESLREVLKKNPKMSEKEFADSSPNWVFYYTKKFLVK
jgi:hypothetical protein